jgi:hypothetical protein
MTYNEFEIDAGLTLRVQAWAQPDEATALRRYEMVRDLLVADRGNVSVWRVQRPSTGTWVVVICGRPENIVELEGEPYEFTDEEASAFVARRLAVGRTGHALGADDVMQFGNYREGGAVITADGGIAPAPVTQGRED